MTIHSSAHMAIKMYFIPYDRGMFLVSWGQISPSRV